MTLQFDSNLLPHLFLAGCLQQPPAGFDKDFCAGDDVGIVGVLGPVVADAADRGHEQHGCGHDGCENLRVMAGAARHAQRFAGRNSCAGRLDRILESRIHHGRRAGADAFDRHATGALR